MMVLFASQIVAYKGTYNSTASYTKGDVVLDQSNSYLALQDNVGIPTSNTMYWGLLAKEASIIDDTNPNSATTTYSASKIQTFLDGKAPISHKHTFSNITDVDVTTVLPVNNNVLTFTNGKWVPKAVSSGGGTSSSIIAEDWDGGETVELLDDEPPADVAGVNITYLDQTSLILNWVESTSSDTKDYTIYNGSTLIATVSATASKLQPLSYQVTGLTTATNYTFTIKARDTSNNEATGISISVRTYGNQAISMNGTSDYIKLPSLTFDTIELTCTPSPPVFDGSIGRIFVDSRPGIATSYFGYNEWGNIQYGEVWTKILVNGTAPADVQSIKYIRTKMTLTLGLSSPGTDDINIFSTYQDVPSLPGKIYSIKIWNGSTLAASYNLTEQFAGTSIADTSGNGKTAVLYGGTWVTG